MANMNIEEKTIYKLREFINSPKNVANDIVAKDDLTIVLNGIKETLENKKFLGSIVYGKKLHKTIKWIDYLIGKYGNLNC